MISVQLECSLDVMEFLWKEVFVTNLVGTADQGAVNRRLCSWMVEGSAVEVSVRVGGLAVDLVVEGTIRFPGQANVKEGEVAVLLLLHGELDGGVSLVQVSQEFLKEILTVGPNGEGVVHSS